MFFNWANHGLFLLFFYFYSFHNSMTIIYVKAKMECSGFEPKAAGCKVHVNPLGYGFVTMVQKLLYGCNQSRYEIMLPLTNVA